jgi:hypothetical protein
MIDPGGAVTVHSVVFEASCQKAAKLWGGGEHKTIAGVETDTEVSLISLLGELFKPSQSTEHVLATPWLAGGAQISIWDSLTLL